MSWLCWPILFQPSLAGSSFQIALQFPANFGSVLAANDDSLMEKSKKKARTEGHDKVIAIRLV